MDVDIDVMNAFESDPPEIDFIWSGFPRKTVGALVAPGAVGKSFWALEAAMGVACSVPGGNLLGLSIENHGKVVYFSAEDPEEIIRGRIHSIGKNFNLEQKRSIAENLVIKDMSKYLLDLDDSVCVNILIQDWCAVHEPRLIVFDTLSRFHKLNENDNGAMAYLITLLTNIAVRTEAAILFLHHVSKSSAREGSVDHQHAARGASALIDNARWCGYLSKMTKEEAASFAEGNSFSPISDENRRLYVRFGVSKQNYGLIESDRWFKRSKGGVLLPVTLTGSIKNNKKGDRYKYVD